MAERKDIYHLREEDIVEIEHWSDMTDDPLYIDTISPDRLEKGKVIGRYGPLLPHRHCRISTCGQVHGTGWFLHFDNNTRSFIGVDCGLGLFPWLERSSKVFNKVDKKRRAKKRVRSLLTHLDELEPTINAFLRNEAAPVLKVMRDFTNNWIEYELLRTLREMERTGENLVRYTKLRTQKDQEDFKEINPNASASEIRYETVTLGSVKGLNALTFKKLHDLEDECDFARRRLNKLDLEQATTLLINSTAGECEMVDQQFREAQEVVSAFRAFVLEQNIVLLHRIVPKGNERDRVSRFYFDPQSGKWGELSEQDAVSRLKTFGLYGLDEVG